MNQEITIALATGVLAMLGWGFADFFAKKTVDEIGNLKTLLWAQFFGLIPLYIYYLFNFKPLILDITTLGLLMMFGITDALGYLLFYRGLEKGKVSVMSPIFASYAAFIVLISVFLFGEILSSAQWLYLAIVFLGIFLTSFQMKDFSFSKGSFGNGLPEVLIAVAIFSFWFPLWDDFLKRGNSLGYVLLLRVIATMTLLLYAHIKEISLGTRQSKIWKWLMLIGIFDVIGYITFSYGFEKTHLTSVVSMLSSAFSLPTLILARIFLKEKLDTNQVIGVIAIIGGIIFLAVTGS
jgi:drug/metabolite transporter (DMT)-like permease